MSGASITSLLQYFVAGLSGLAALKLWRTELYRRYPALFGFLLFVSLLSLAFLASSVPVYVTCWKVLQPFTWLFSVWVVLELYSVILEKHKGLATLGRWMQYAGFTVSTLVSLLALLPRIRAGTRQADPVLVYYYGIERGVDCGMLVFLLLLLVWLTHYPVPLSRNVVTHSFVYTALFLTNSVGLFGQAFFGFTLSRPVTLALTAVFGLCILTWLTLLNANGEEIRVTVSHFSAEHEERVLQQLDAVNEALLRLSTRQFYGSGDR
jgi:hypothetical protein